MEQQPNQSAMPAGMDQMGYGSGFQDTLCNLLDDVTVLQGMPYTDLKVVSGYVHAYNAKRGTVLYEEGKKSDFMCFLVDGELRVEKECGQDETRYLTTIRAGKSVGEMSLIDNSSHSATVMADSDVVLLVLTRFSLERLREDHPRIAFDLLWKVAQVLSFRLRQTSGQLIDYL